MFGEGTGANFGGGTLDWGFLGAIAGRKNFDALKQEKLRELNLVQQQNALLENNVAQQQAAADGVSQYLDIVNNLKVLPEGLDRIKKIDADLRTNITKGILESNGDVKKWILSGGDRVLKEYQKNLVNNDVTQREIANAYQTNKWMADQQAGLQERWSGMNEDGTPITFDQQFKKYKNGQIDKLDYNGAFKLPEYNSTIPKRYAFEDKYRPKSADVNDVYNDAFQQFKDLPLADRKQAAIHHAQLYQEQLKSGAAPYQFLHDQMSPVDYARINNLNSSTRKNNAATGLLTTTQNSFLQSWADGVRNLTGNETIVGTDGKPITAIPYEQLNVKDMDAYMGLSGLSFDNKGLGGNDTKSAIKNMPLFSFGNNGKLIQVDLSGTTGDGIESVERADSRIYSFGKDRRPYAKVKVTLNEKGGMERAKLGDALMEEEHGLTSTNNLPLGSEYKDKAFFALDDKQGVIETFVPLNVTPKNLQREKKELGYFGKAQDGFAGYNINAGAFIMQNDDMENDYSSTGTE